MSMYYSPYLTVASQNYKFYKQCGITGYVLSEFSGDIKGPRNAFNELKTFIASKIMWDPDRWHVDDLVKEFCTYYYQEYSDIAYKTIENMEKQIQKLSTCSRNYSMCHSIANWEQFFPLEVLKENENLVDQAIKDNEKNKEKSTYRTIKTRLQMLKLGFMFNQANEYDSYYPRSTKAEKNRFYKEYFSLLEKTKWDDYVGKTEDFFIGYEKERLGFGQEKKI